MELSRQRGVFTLIIQLAISVVCCGRQYTVSNESMAAIQVWSSNTGPGVKIAVHWLHQLPEPTSPGYDNSTVTILKGSCAMLNSESQNEWFIPDVSLSPECGPEYFRCRELFVETFHILQDGSESTVIFVPLESGMLLLNMWYDINNCTLDLQTEIVSCSDCSPTVVYKTDNKVFTVCISSVNNYIAVYEIQVHWNRSLIHDVVFVGPLTRVSITNLAESYLSNFVLKLLSQEHKVFFAIDSSIYVMDVLNPSQAKQYPELPGCDRVHSLSSVPGGPLLLAYCSDRSFYYDTSYGDWTKKQIYSGHGIPYLCPNGNYMVTFFNDTWRSLQFSVTNSNPMIIGNVDVTSGVCFEVGNTTYFVWLDQQQNTVSVFNFTMQTHYPVTSYECLTMDCPRLFLYENVYVVIRDDRNIIVLDAENSFSQVLLMKSNTSSSGLLALLSLVLSNICPSASPTSDDVPSSTNDNHGETTVNLPTNQYNSVPTTLIPNKSITDESTDSDNHGETTVNLPTNQYNSVPTTLIPNKSITDESTDSDNHGETTVNLPTNQYNSVPTTLVPTKSITDEPTDSGTTITQTVSTLVISPTTLALIIVGSIMILLVTINAVVIAVCIFKRCSKSHQ